MQARRDLLWRRSSSSNHVLTRVAFASAARLRKDRTSRWNATSNGEHCLGSYTTPSACTARRPRQALWGSAIALAVGTAIVGWRVESIHAPECALDWISGVRRELNFLPLDASTLTQDASNGVSRLCRAPEALASIDYVVTASVASSWRWQLGIRPFINPALLLAGRRCCRLLSILHTG